MKITPECIAYHRNGVSGEPFHAVTFTTDGEDGKPQRMVAIVFDAPGHVAVLDRDLLNGPESVKFGLNSWRGDHYATALRRTIAKHNAAPAT